VSTRAPVRHRAVPADVRDGEVDGYASIVLEAGPTSATFVPELGLLGTSLRHDGGEYLDLTGGATKVLSQHTTGLPLLAPWANRLAGDHYRVGRRRVDLSDAPGLHRDGGGLPIHGTMLGRPGWQVVRSGPTGAGGARLTARFDAGHDDVVMASFPFPHVLGVVAAVTPHRLEVTVSVTATGRTKVPVAFGWHPYFRLPDEDPYDLRVELPSWRRLQLDDRMLPTGASVREPASTTTLPVGGLDHAFALPTRHRAMTLQGRSRSLTLTPGGGYRYAQVYNPAGTPVVALEPMVAPIAGLGTDATPLVAPGDTYTARFRVDLR
jgi:aldose 1-epimerase